MAERPWKFESSRPHQLRLKMVTAPLIVPAASARCRAVEIWGDGLQFETMAALVMRRSVRSGRGRAGRRLHAQIRAGNAGPSRLTAKNAAPVSLDRFAARVCCHPAGWRGAAWHAHFRPREHRRVFARGHRRGHGRAITLASWSAASTRPRSYARVGHIRVFTALAAVTAACSLIFAIEPYSWLWIGLRCVVGYCFAGPLHDRGKLDQRTVDQRQSRAGAGHLPGGRSGRDDGGTVSCCCWPIRAGSCCFRSSRS